MPTTANQIKGEAEKVKQVMGNDMSLKAFADYIKRLGYELVFYNTPSGDAELQRYGVQQLAEETSAFVYCGVAKIVFVDSNLPYGEKVRNLAHEIGHIVLNHVGLGDSYLRDSEQSEREAQTFAYMMLDDTHDAKMRHKAVTAVILCVVTVIGVVVQIMRANRAKGGDMNG